MLCSSLFVSYFLPSFPYSKSARRKKREEAIKLPEVSKDIYFDVTMDLKGAFGSVKDIQNEDEVVAWDQGDDEENKDEAPQEDMHAFSFLSNQESEPLSGFKFSFFGDDAVTKKPIAGEKSFSINYCLMMYEYEFYMM